jgi:hypothetical protein
MGGEKASPAFVITILIESLITRIGYAALRTTPSFREYVISIIFSSFLPLGVMNISNSVVLSSLILVTVRQGLYVLSTCCTPCVALLQTQVGYAHRRFSHPYSPASQPSRCFPQRV